MAKKKTQNNNITIKLKYLKKGVAEAERAFKKYPTLKEYILSFVVSIDEPWFYIKVVR